jgi:hypothetical protein
MERVVMGTKLGSRSNFEHDVAISYAGEDREIAGRIAEHLRDKGLSVFYDKFYKSDLWGKELSTWFKGKYGKKSRFVLVLVSRNYPVKDWTDFEFSTAKAEENRRKREFILPVRLDQTILAGLPSDKGYLDFKEVGIEGIARNLVEKVMRATSQKGVDDIFREAFQAWKMEGFLPGTGKVDYFLNNIRELPLDVNTCEFLLRSLTGYYGNLAEKLSVIDRQLIFEASQRMLVTSEAAHNKWHGMRYLVFANAGQAEAYLWDIYRNVGEDIDLRADALGKLWKCASKRGIDESYRVILEERSWQLRQAAAKNIAHGRVRKNTPEVLRRALKDKRYQVRVEAARAVVRLNIHDLASDLIRAFENERSRIGANRLLYYLWYFNKHSDVQAFMKKYDDLPHWFHKTPSDDILADDKNDDLYD